MSDEERKNRSSNSLAGLENGLYRRQHLDSTDSCRSSLSCALDAMVNESNAYSNYGVITGGAFFNKIQYLEG